jgi:hypothetical protein
MLHAELIMKIREDGEGAIPMFCAGVLRVLVLVLAAGCSRVHTACDARWPRHG